MMGVKKSPETQACSEQMRLIIQADSTTLTAVTYRSSLKHDFTLYGKLLITTTAFVTSQ
jgi:hypothetical protein